MKQPADNHLQPLKPSVSDDDKTAYKTGPVYYYEAKAGSILAGHSHDYAETLWVVAGNGRITIDLLAERFHAPCVIDIPANSWHKFMPETDVKFVELRYSTGNT